jgi:prepilin-type N-terminal cleavage/methylation domain-containing protein
MKNNNKVSVPQINKQLGFTLIEMIGVLAIIAVLVGAVAPRIFEAISDSKVSNVASLIKTTETATSKYFADMGNLLPFTNMTANSATSDAAGHIDNGNTNSFSRLLTSTRSSTQNAGEWINFKGPYLSSFNRNTPPLGTGMGLDVDISTATLAVASGENWDLDGDGAADIAVGSQMVILRLQQISEGQWEKIDAILDNGVATGTPAERQARGKVKWNSANRDLRILIANN